MALAERGVGMGPTCSVPLVRRVRAERLTYLEPEALFELGQAVARVEREGLPGDLLEAGCALGGSAVVMARAKARQRGLTLHDVFGQIPPPTDEDGPDIQQRYAEIAGGEARGIDGDPYYGYLSELKGQVADTLRRFGRDPAAHNVHLVQGLFEDTLRPAGPVALAHLDCDWYASVKVCLERIWPALVPGGRLVIDDYHHWSGCRRAVDEFVAALPAGEAIPRIHSRLHLVKGR